MNGVKDIRLIGVLPVHPGRGAPSRIQLAIGLTYLKNEPLGAVELTEEEAFKLIEQTVAAIRIVRNSKP